MTLRFRTPARTTATLGLAALAIPLIGLIPAYATPLEVASEQSAQVIAQAPARTFTASASIPNGIVVRGHRGRMVSLTTPGAEAVNKRGKASEPIVFTGLTPGRSYGVWVNNEDPIAVVPVAKVNDASHLVVRTSESPGAVDLTWTHKRTNATGGKAIAYRITATSDGVPTIRQTVTGTSTAHLVGLQGTARYRFTVTPMNAASTGKATTALMTRTLDEITGSKADLAIDLSATPDQPAQPMAAPTVAPATADTTAAPQNTNGGSPARPATRTIYVCPDGYADAGNTCEMTRAYTFHTETQTLAYTFHAVHSGGWNACIEYNPDGSYKGQYPCYTPETTTQVKDAAPDGYSDNGSAWVKDIQVKDTTPAGYSDNGSAWVATAEKIAQVVPA